MFFIYLYYDIIYKIILNYEILLTKMTKDFFVFLASIEIGFKQLIELNEDLHKKILCYEPIWIEDLKEDLKQYNVNISMQKLITFLDDKVNHYKNIIYTFKFQS